MKKWRKISFFGIVLGVTVMLPDLLVKDIPYAVIIPLEIVSIVLIYAGFIIRKRDNNRTN